MAYTILLILHVVGGTASLTSGLVAILASKGRLVHRRAGFIYFISMLITDLAAIGICLIKPNAFLMHLAIFTFVLIIPGYLSAKTQKSGALNYIGNIIGLANGILMILTMDIIMLSFGGLSMIIFISDLYQLVKKDNDRVQRISRHIGMMGGSYIATLTAFLAVNTRGIEPAWLPWLLPSIIGTPLLIYSAKKFTQKFSRT